MTSDHKPKTRSLRFSLLDLWAILLMSILPAEISAQGLLHWMFIIIISIVVI